MHFGCSVAQEDDRQASSFVEQSEDIARHSVHHLVGVAVWHASVPNGVQRLALLVVEGDGPAVSLVKYSDDGALRRPFFWTPSRPRTLLLNRHIDTVQRNANGMESVGDSERSDQLLVDVLFSLAVQTRYCLSDHLEACLAVRKPPKLLGRPNGFSFRTLLEKVSHCSRRPWEPNALDRSSP
jgi:hypothetical protein